MNYFRIYISIPENFFWSCVDGNNWELIFFPPLRGSSTNNFQEFVYKYPSSLTLRMRQFQRARFAPFPVFFPQLSTVVPLSCSFSLLFPSKPYALRFLASHTETTNANSGSQGRRLQSQTQNLKCGWDLKRQMGRNFICVFVYL